MPRGRTPLPPGEALRRKRERNRQWMRDWGKAHPDEKREKNRVWMRKKQAALGKEQRANLARQAKSRDPIGYLVAHAKSRAAAQGIPFDLTRADLEMPDFCPVFGLPFEWGKGQMGWRNMRAPSLDKIKPELGYVKGNVMVISNRANHLKSNGSISEFEAVLAYMRRVGAHAEPMPLADKAVTEAELPLFKTVGW